jgi:hypothetical protein
MDADDVVLPGRLQAQVEYLERHDDVVLLGTQVDFFVGERRFRGPRTPPDHAAIVGLALRGKWSMCQPSMMARSWAVQSVRGYRVDGAGEELDFLLRMSEAGRVANLTEVLHLMRIRPDSVNFTWQDEIRMGCGFAIECAKCRQAGSPEPTLRAFKEAWKRRGIVAAVLDRIDGWSIAQYRKALLDLGESRRALGWIRLACASVCRPEAVLRRIQGRWSHHRNVRETSHD